MGVEHTDKSPSVHHCSRYPLRRGVFCAPKGLFLHRISIDQSVFCLVFALKTFCEDFTLGNEPLSQHLLLGFLLLPLSELLDCPPNSLASLLGNGARSRNGHLLHLSLTMQPGPGILLNTMTSIFFSCLQDAIFFLVVLTSDSVPSCLWGHFELDFIEGEAVRWKS